MMLCGANEELLEGRRDLEEHCEIFVNKCTEYYERWYNRPDLMDLPEEDDEGSDRLSEDTREAYAELEREMQASGRTLGSWEVRADSSGPSARW